MNFMSNNQTFQQVNGKLGILTPGMGAVATTFIAGVIAARNGQGAPVGSLTQMGRIRLGKRTENRQPLIKNFVPLASLQDIVFGGWDIFEDNVYQAASHAKVLDQQLLDDLRTELETIRPMSAVFDSSYIRNINGPNVKTGTSKVDLA
jgi:myo-inositol-1-phosphate synthase